MTFWPAPGRMGLAALCGFPWSEHAPRWPKREFSENAARAFGEAFGNAIQGMAVLGGSPEAMARAAADAKGLGTSDRRRLVICVEHAARHLDEDATYRSAEVPLLFDVVTGAAWEAKSREESFRPPDKHLGSVLDVVTVGSRGLVVTDWKTGFAQASEEKITESWQLRAYGLFAARAFGADEVTVELAHVSEEGVRSDPMTLDVLELGLIEARIRGLLKWLGQGQPPRSGRHCTSKYCPILSVCPIPQKAMLQIQRSVDAATALPVTAHIQDEEHAKKVRRGLKMVKSALPAIEAALDLWVERNGGFEIEPGVWYGPVEHEGKRRVDVEVPGALKVIREHLGEHAEMALSLDTSQAALKRAARSAAAAAGDTERGAEGRVFKPLWAELQNVGAVKQGASYVTVEEKKISRASTEETPAALPGDEGEAA